jgi:hypothetical protein
MRSVSPRALMLHGFTVQTLLVPGVGRFPECLLDEVAEGPKQARRSEARRNRGPELLHEGLLKHKDAQSRMTAVA